MWPYSYLYTFLIVFRSMTTHVGLSYSGLLSKQLMTMYYFTCSRIINLQKKYYYLCMTFLDYIQPEQTTVRFKGTIDWESTYIQPEQAVRYNPLHTARTNYCWE